MSNPINVNGRTLGSTNGPDQDYEVLRENQSLLSRYPTEYAKQATKAGDRVRSATYPLNGGNSHYIRFFINLNEESKLIRLNKVGIDKTTDLTGQNRSSQNSTSQDALTAALVGAGAAVGANIAASTAVATKTTATGLKLLFQKKLTGGIVGATAATVGLGVGAAAGAAAGSSIGELVSDYLKVTNQLKTLAANITLYTPANIVANYKLNYDMQDDLLVVLAQSENFEAAKAGLAALGSPMSDIGDGSLADSEKWKQAGNAAGKFGRILATGASKTVSMLSRTAVNKRKDVMFSHVGNRTFAFNYTFAPKSAAEAKEVDDIIFMFKYFAHPEMLPGYGNFLYLYPAEFDIEYGLIPNNPDTGNATKNTNEFLNRISSCVLVDINVNYAPSDSFQSLENGEPLITTLNLTFMEIETLHRDRIGEGF